MAKGSHIRSVMRCQIVIFGRGVEHLLKSVPRWQHNYRPNNGKVKPGRGRGTCRAGAAGGKTLQILTYHSAFPTPKLYPQTIILHYSIQTKAVLKRIGHKLAVAFTVSLYNNGGFALSCVVYGARRTILCWQNSHACETNGTNFDVMTMIQDLKARSMHLTLPTCFTKAYLSLETV